MTEGGKLYVVVRHDTSVEDSTLDKKNPYFLKATLASDPDLNEPNETVVKATKLTVATCGTPVEAKGALSTKGDLDVFEVQVTPCPGAARSILYVEAKAPASPSLKIRLAYSLDTAAGIVASDYSPNPMEDQVLATARITAGGKYTFTIRAHRGKDDKADPPGDPSFLYTVKIAVYADKDVNEGPAGNDTTATATASGLTSGNSKTFSGRLTYIGDADTYSVTAPSNAPARLHYKLTYQTAPGQFPAVPRQNLRELVVFSATTPVDCNATCTGNKDYVQAWCGQGKCLRQRRQEDASIDKLGNFEGQVFLPGNSGAWYVQVNFTGGDGADDLTYDLVLTVKPSATDPHPESNPQVVNLPAEGTAVLGYGYGQQGPGVPNGLPRLARSPYDYDADFDRQWFEFRFPVPSPSRDQTMDLSWSVAPAPGQTAGQRSYDAGLHFFFCKDGNACTKKVGVPANDLNAFFGYRSGKVYTWYRGKNDAGLGGEATAFDFNQNTGTVSVRPAMCTCLDGLDPTPNPDDLDFVSAGKFYVAADPYNRTSYADSTLKVSVSLKPYPQTVLDDDNKSFACPTPCGYVGSFAAVQK